MTDTVTTFRVGAGDHACLTFTDADERMDLIAAFVRDGLRAGSKVVCWTDSWSGPTGSGGTGGPDTLAAQLEARSVRPGAAIRRGQLHLAPAAGTLLGDRTVTTGGMVEVLSREVETAAREGYRGLRVTADMGWATGPLAAADELVAFESAVSDLLGDGRLCLICQYDRDRFDAVTLAFAAKAHTKTVAAQVYFEHPLLRVCRQYSPPGVRVAGQLDYRHRDVLEQALTESLRLDRHMHVNLGGLEYLDGACAGVIVATAMRLPASRRMTVTCRRAVATVLELVGASAATRLRVKPAHEQP
jgi:anti-anti-sigma regulatory factor